MTHDNDLIRRGDAMDMCHGYWRDTRTRIMSIPAVAAKADYEARILAAIDVQPDPRDWQIAALVDAIENIRVTYLLPPSFQLPLDLAIAAVKGENK